MANPTAAELLSYGYSPGSYAILCTGCGQEKHDCNKQAFRCKDCATLKWETDEQHRQEISGRIQGDVRGALAKRQAQVREQSE